MRKIFLAVIILGAAAVLAGCKKDNGDKGGGGGGSTARIHTRYSETAGDTSTFTYEYNMDGKLTKLVHSKAGQEDYVQLYVYSAGRVEYLLPSASDTIRSTYFLNSQGLADSSVSEFGESVTRFSYDANGYLIRGVRSNMGHDFLAATYSIAGGNLVSIANDPPVNYTETYTYTDKVNTIGNENTGQGWMGKQSVNLMATQHIEPSNYNSSFTYEFDSLGRVSSYVQVSGSGSSSVTKYTITYY